MKTKGTEHPSNLRTNHPLRLLPGMPTAAIDPIHGTIFVKTPADVSSEGTQIEYFADSNTHTSDELRLRAPLCCVKKPKSVRGVPFPPWPRFPHGGTAGYYDICCRISGNGELDSLPWTYTFFSFVASPHLDARRLNFPPRQPQRPLCQRRYCRKHRMGVD